MQIVIKIIQMRAACVLEIEIGVSKFPNCGISNC